MGQACLVSFWFPHSEGHKHEHVQKIFKGTHIFPLRYELFLYKNHQHFNSILLTFKYLKITGTSFLPAFDSI